MLVSDGENNNFSQILTAHHLRLSLSVFSGERPKINTEWPSSIQDVLQMCFATSPNERPTIAFIFESIRSELCQARGGRTSRLRNSYLLRNRSLESVEDSEDYPPSTKTERIGNALRSSLTGWGRRSSA